MKLKQVGLSLLLVAASRVLAGQGEEAGAEYAYRWRPQQGGPADGKAVLALLGQPLQKMDQVLVQYYTVEPPKDAPAGFTAILRQRSRPDGSKAEVTWKYRGEQGFPDGDWHCPLKGKAKQKREVDVAVLAGGEARKAYSLSCTVKGTVAEVVPAKRQPKAKGCSNPVQRFEGDSVDVEAWQLASGLVLEVSRKQPDGAAELADFQHAVVDRLSAAGAQALGGSKSLLGSECS
ncbi:hypothetical protein [Chitinimonas sp.]|uniref:hypothetical protein n=1 Tax=Chitinimonas sp. TaxID=1934313 RepID=UPI002F947997